jgi:hypothetical protein
MSRKGKCNLKGKIEYPRKCNHCEYISNNPSMYHYHKKIHEPIPQGKLCDHGCGQLATSINTHAKYTCLPIAQHCPEYIKKQSHRVKEQWLGNTERKHETKQRFLKHCAGNPNAIAKQKETCRKRSGLVTPELAKEYRHYARKARQLAQVWAKEQGYAIGKQTFHVDHKFSVLDCWKAGLPLSLVNHPNNLQIIDAKINSGKGSKSSITLEELLKFTD